MRARVCNTIVIRDLRAFVSFQYDRNVISLPLRTRCVYIRVHRIAPNNNLKAIIAIQMVKIRIGIHIYCTATGRYYNINRQHKHTRLNCDFAAKQTAAGPLLPCHLTNNIITKFRGRFTTDISNRRLAILIIAAKKN
jgi:hypothetical protein